MCYLPFMYHCETYVRLVCAILCICVFVYCLCINCVLYCLYTLYLYSFFNSVNHTTGAFYMHSRRLCQGASGTTTYPRRLTEIASGISNTPGAYAKSPALNLPLASFPNSPAIRWVIPGEFGYAPAIPTYHRQGGCWRVATRQQ